MQPLHNNSADPETDKWWNSDGYMPTPRDLPKGKVLALDDWHNIVEFWYCVRNSLFHGGDSPSVGRGIFLVEHAY